MDPAAYDGRLPSLLGRLRLLGLSCREICLDCHVAEEVLRGALVEWRHAL